MSKSLTFGGWGKIGSTNEEEEKSCSALPEMVRKFIEILCYRTSARSRAPCSRPAGWLWDLLSCLQLLLDQEPKFEEQIFKKSHQKSLQTKL